MKEKWKNIWQKKMEFYEEPEPLGLWEDIENAFIKKRGAPIIHYRKALLWSAAIGGIAAMLALVFLLGNRDSSLPTIPTPIEFPTAKQYIPETELNKKSDKVFREIEKRESLFASNTTAYNKQQVDSNKEEPFVVISDKEVSSEKFQDQIVEESQDVVTDDLNNRKTKPAKKSESQTNDRSYFSKGRTNYETTDNYSYRRTSKNQHTLTASIYSSNLPNTTGESNGYGELIPRTTLSQQISGSAVGEQNPADDIIFSNMGEEPYTNIEHKQPVKAGLSVRYQINDKLGVESGVTYTYLSSNLTSGTAKNLYKTEQSLQYIGIPLNLSYNVWDSKQLSFYLSAGGLLEKSIAGKSHTDYIIDNKIVSTDDEKIKEKTLQFSVNGSVGLQYNLSSKLGLFVEPGVAYYVNNGSSIKTIYKDKPMNFNLKIGLRVVLK